MNLNQLLYFCALAKLEHYTKAAEELQISQPTLSQAIASLEKEIGISLFEKHGRNVALTKDGRIYLSYVETALKELDNGRAYVQRLNSSGGGHVNLAFISTVGAYFVPRLITGFIEHEEHRSIMFSCFEGNTEDILNGLKEERFDIAICSKKEDEPHFDFVPVLQQDLVILTPSAHPLAGRKSLTLHETAAYPFILHTHKTGMRTIEDRLFENCRITPIVSCEVEIDRSIAGLVAANLGIAVVSRSPDIENFDIRTIPLVEPVYSRYIYMTTYRKHRLSASAQSFKTFILDRFHGLS